MKTTQTIDREASEWIARLDREPVPAPVRESFEAWCAENPRHLAAYLRQRDTWTRLERLQVLRPARRSSVEPHASRGLGTLRSRYSGRPGLTIWRAAGLAAVLVALGVGAWLWKEGLFPGAGEQIYATNIGGLEHAVLPDGSVIELNTDTRLRADMAGGQRIVRIERGEASFKVAHDPRRPFVVMVAGTAIRALGTQFNVRQRGESVEIVVVEGVIDVRRSRAIVSGGPDPDSSLPRITAGRMAIAGSTGIEVRTLSEDQIQRALAWHDGMLYFDGETVEYAVAEFNRYNERKLVVADPAIAALRLGGQFRSTNTMGFAESLRQRFGVRVTEEADRIVLRAPSSPP